MDLLPVDGRWRKWTQMMERPSGMVLEGSCRSCCGGAKNDEKS